MRKSTLLLIGTVLFCSCAGTIHTVRHINTQSEYKKAVIISAENSNYIQFQPGIITPF